MMKGLRRRSWNKAVLQAQVQSHHDRQSSADVGVLEMRQRIRDVLDVAVQLQEINHEAGLQCCAFGSFWLHYGHLESSFILYLELIVFALI
jgi:hypothetical protein